MISANSGMMEYAQELHHHSAVAGPQWHTITPWDGHPTTPEKVTQKGEKSENSKIPEMYFHVFESF